MLESNNIRLRALEASDLPFLYQWENDAAMWEYSDTHNPLSQRALRDYIASSQHDIFKDGQLRLIIEKQGFVIGAADLFDFDGRNRKAALGLYIAPQWQGQHIAHIVVKMMEHYAFGTLNLHQLYAVVGERNDACKTLFRDLGYDGNAILRDWICQNEQFTHAIVFQKTYTREKINNTI